MYKYLLLILMGLSTNLQAQNSVTLSGEISDAANGESLIGATLYIEELGEWVITNVYGFYSITLSPGTYNVIISYVGFDSQSQLLTLDQNTKRNVELRESDKELEAVTVSAEREDANVTNLEMSTSRLDIK